jgi:hypothetical protein
MRYNKMSLIFLMLLCFGMSGIRAQSTASASGGNAGGAGGSASYTVGQITYTVLTGLNGNLIQGVQQPYEISNVSGMDEASNPALEMNLYPNPVSDALHLRISGEHSSALAYRLLDNTGRLLLSKEMNGDEAEIAMDSYAPAIYFLQLTENSKVIRTFKIVKN